MDVFDASIQMAAKLPIFGNAAKELERFFRCSIAFFNNFLFLPSDLFCSPKIEFLNLKKEEYRK